MVDAVEREKCLDGVVGDEPEEDGQKDPNGVPMFAGEQILQALPHIWLFHVGVVFVDFGFTHKDEHQRGRDQHKE